MEFQYIATVVGAVSIVVGVLWGGRKVLTFIGIGKSPDEAYHDAETQVHNVSPDATMTRIKNGD